MSDALTLAYNTTVYDWSRLSEVGPETQEAGYWGLFWPDELTGIVVPYMVNGYQITVMKALLPLTYNLHTVVGQKSASADPYGKDPEPRIEKVAKWRKAVGAVAGETRAALRDFRPYSRLRRLD